MLQSVLRLMGLATGSNAVNATFYQALPFNFLRDTVPVAGIVRYPLVMVVNPSVPIACAKANAGKITMASSGTGTMVHLAGRAFQSHDRSQYGSFSRTAATRQH
jgi:tripartite-type tricarboxylate transporter receptor subunit TctC